MAKRRLSQVIQPPDYICRSIRVRHHYGEEIREVQIFIDSVRWNEEVKNVGCHQSITAKNVTTVNNGSTLIPATTITNGSASKSIVSKQANF
jgi:hypothetical protein